MSELINKNGSLSFERWVKRGNFIINRDFLDPSDKDQTYNFLTRHGIIPEEYGIEHPLKVKFKDKSRGQLIDEIISLREEIKLLNKFSTI